MKTIGELIVVAGLFMLTWQDEGFKSAVNELRLYFSTKQEPEVD